MSFVYKVLQNCLFYLLQLFGLFYPVKSGEFMLYEGKCWIFGQIYAILLSIVIALGYVCLEWFSVITVYKITRTSNIILLVLTHSSFVSIGLLSILGTAFWNREKWGRYLKLQQILKSKTDVKLRRNETYFCLEFILGNAAVFVVIGVDYWRHNISTIDDSVHMFTLYLKNYLIYYIFLITVVIYNIILFLKDHFRALNTYITKAVGLEGNKKQFTLYKPLTLKNTIVTVPKAVISEKTLSNFTEASKILSILFECVDIFNNIFGLVIMLINMATVLTILKGLNTILIAAETSQLTPDVIFDCLLGCLIFLAWNSFILSAAGLLREESLDIVKICCKLQHLLPQFSQERKELLNLAHQIRRKIPIVSAAGFFEVDFYLSLAIFTYVGNCTVALIQFSYMDF